ncbi:Epl1 protein [Martiniozyma asiatica (nom. inval.)]|nr:Epl1 protein [Martiniozyma asiatica]
MSSAGARFRQRKISVKQMLQVMKQRDIPDLDLDDQQRELQHIETGVEKGEEEEHHLQQVIHASEAKFKGAKVEQVYIPTPDASKVWKDAGKYYTEKFNAPKSYITSSATVEDCCGCPYNLDEIDEIWLQKYNTKQKAQENKITDDEFEIVAHKFETTINLKQPFLSIDPSNIMSYKEIKEYVLNPNDIDPSSIAQSLAEKLQIDRFKTELDAVLPSEPRPLTKLLEMFGEAIYEHWKIRRIERGGKPVFPTLKFEDPNQKDDTNPYTCFRRREFKQTRKTRRTDTQSAFKLKTFYKNLRRTNKTMFNVALKEVEKSKKLDEYFESFEKRNKLRLQKRADPTVKIEDDEFNPPEKIKFPPIIESLDQDREAMIKKQKEKEAAQRAAAEAKAEAEAAQAAAQAQRKKEPVPKKTIQKSHQRSSTSQTNLQPYVKLPPSKVPDLDMTTVNAVLVEKHDNIRKAVNEKLKKRRENDVGWQNFTDDPYNPYFDMSISNESSLEQMSHFPCSAIVSSLFQVENSREIKFNDTLNSHRSYSSTDSDILRINGKTGELMKNDRRTALPIYYDIAGEEPMISDYGLSKQERFEKFNDHNRLSVSEAIMKLRKRRGRLGQVWIDRKRTSDDTIFEEYINMPSDEEIEESLFENSVKMDVGADEETETSISKKRRRNVYDVGSDSRKRLKSRFSFDYDLPTMNPLDPSTLNRIGKQAQVIRFGSMLLKKAYDNMSTLRAKQYSQMQQLRQQQIAAAKAHQKSSSVETIEPKTPKADKLVKEAKDKTKSPKRNSQVSKMKQEKVTNIRTGNESLV